MKRVLAVRHDNNGDVILAGPAIRALASRASVTLLCGPRGQSAANLLPGVAALHVWEAPWIDPEPDKLEPAHVSRLLRWLRDGSFDEAVIFTSFHQSPLPTALVLRLAGIERIGAISVDYPGSLLDVRHGVPEDVHEVERGLSLAQACGYALPPGDDRRLRLTRTQEVPAELTPAAAYVIVHPGCTAPARTWSDRGYAGLVASLKARGWNVVLTGVAGERELCERIAGNCDLVNAAGRTTFAQFATLVRGAAAVVSGNTVAPHVAAAMGTPVVAIFPPTIPAVRFHPWNVRHVLLGDQDVPCAGCRARVCPIKGQPCLAALTPALVSDAVDALVASRPVALAS